MEFNATLELNSLNEILRARGLQDGGVVQKSVDNMVMEKMKPYMPFRTGGLEKAMQSGTVVGSGLIVVNAPQARFLYYGKVMIGEKSRSAYAKPNEKKIVTNKDLEYDRTAHSQAGPLFFERMKTQHKDEIIREAARVAGAEVVIP